MSGGLGQRPLSEVSPMAQRRNSPIWNQSGKITTGDSTYDVSPLNNNASPRLFWKGRESPSPTKGVENHAPYDPESCVLPARRASLENLKRASRVKNHAMLRDGQEYDPAHVSVPQRPLAADRSPNRESQMNLAKSQFVDDEDLGDLGDQVPRPHSPAKNNHHQESRLSSKGSRYGKGFDPQHDIWSEYDSAGHRHAKSVTFDVSPPQINEYEMRTPDLSSVASESREPSYDSEEDDDVSSFEHDSFMDRDDSFDASLEDIEKTPVVLPEDWRFMSPDSNNGEEDSFVEHTEDQNDSRPTSRDEVGSQHSRVESLDSNGERRPLPPLPSVNRLSGSRPSSPEKLAAAFELGSGGQRVLPSAPAAASYTKSDINGGMSLEERLRLMMLNDKKKNEELNASHPKTMFFSPPRISRDSILRDIRKGDSFEEDVYEDEDSHVSEDAHHFDKYDPDVPIPSLETEYDDDDSSSVIIKEEATDDDLYAIPDYYQNSSDHSLSSRDQRATYDQDSNYSLRSAAEAAQAAAFDDEDRASRQTTPTGGEDVQAPANPLSKGMDDSAAPRESQALDMASIRQSLNRPVTPEIKEEELSEPSTPDSVIRHPIQDEEDEDAEFSQDEEEEDQEFSSSDESVPEPIATIKAPGQGLKTRPSLTPADVDAMAATRRKISGQHAPPVLDMPKQTPQEPETSDTEDLDKATDLPPQLTLPTLTQRQSSLMQLDIPFSIQEESLGSGLNKEFDRVIESQKVAFALAIFQLESSPTPAPKEEPSLAPLSPGLSSFIKFTPHANTSRPQRGYLMRQNTKVVIANNRNDDEPSTPVDRTSNDPRGTRSAGSSPRKASQQTWTTVPWNGSTRRPSIKMAGAIPKKKPVPGVGAVPPLPGQSSNVQQPSATIEENEPVLNEAFEDGEERGRLFVKVVGLKYLDLPMPRGERSYFALTLDNGLHCVTTSWLELGKTAPIGQEFELIVQNDLEFQLTLQMKVDEAKLYPQESASSPNLYDRLRNLVARDGSFGRAYVALSDHEKMAFGRPYTVDIACFNEWAVDEHPSSVKSKKSATSMTAQRRPPYKIGKLELQLLFVPKPKGGKDDDMPKSMNACIREMRDAESVTARSFEGFLSQQGGDCPFWRRRFFKLEGSKLTAYHETTRQPRATINLAKAAKLIDDRSSLVQKETSTRGGGRRKSAFAEEEDGYMFVEEGFRIRFGNGEVIDFYADSAVDKDGWLRVMSEAVGKGATSGNGAMKPWADLVLRRERSMKSRRLTTDRLPPPSSIPVAPSSPVGKRQSVAMGPPASAGTGAQAPQSPRPRPSGHKHTYSQPDIGTDARRQKTRSLMF
ncbi:hypothetical protein N7481_003655 [Penicillium waksmanii]|uniref:uncharacterized protein n=1 Tax=Penicillium waksmanii TaxID=69791 RepID=UPI002548A82E|nr:uncharacterized protein N7481_003655 [Penicillium waksmanii]KAJ5988445.1 hypothetical protein N7481_003655 [Penicillium waksmanii]